MKAFDFFPTAITISEINILPEELERLIAFYNDKSTWVINKGQNFVTSETDVFRNVLGLESSFVNQIQNEIDLYTKEILGEAPSIIPTQSWLNFNPTDTSHEKHFHTNSILSGVFYIKTNDKTGNINFYKPLDKINMIKNKIETFNRYNFEHVYFTPEVGQLFLFPSYMNHSVDKNTSEVTRISLAFNTFYNGEFGEIDRLNKVSFSINSSLT